MDASEKLIRMANQIAAFMASKPHQQGVEGCAAHINDFWEPRMRRALYALLDTKDSRLAPLILEAAPLIRRPQ